MTLLRTALWTILLFAYGVTVAQTADSTKTKILGKWTIIKHTLPEKDKAVDKFKSTETKIIYEFKKDGTYVLTSDWLFQGKWDKVVTVGKWKLSADSKQINLYDNKFLPPHDKDGTCADHPLKSIPPLYHVL